MRSLFIVSLPRSLSTRTYQLCREALGLAEPGWTSDGEVLNLDRYTLWGDEAAGEGRKYTRQEWQPVHFQRILAQLDQITRDHGYAYKDVVQPFAVSRWLPTRDFRILKIERPVVEVAYAMLERGWHYPRRVAESWPDLEAEVLQGLRRAHQALAAIPGEVVSFEALIHDERVLEQAVQRLYPERPGIRFHYLDAAFVGIREQVLARRRTPRFQRLSERLQEVPP